MAKTDLLSRGIMIMDPGAFSALQGTAGTASLETTGFPAGGPTKAVKVVYPASSTAHGQIANASPYIDIPAQASITGLLVEVYNPNSHPMPFHVILYNEAVTQRAECHMAVDVSPGWQLCFIPSADWAQKAFIEADEVRTVRYQMRADYNHCLPAVAGEALYFGRAYINPTQRPVFLLGTDDGYAANVVDQGTGWADASRKNYKAICDHYGFRATAYIVPSWIDTIGYLTLDQLKGLRDSGWTIASHTYSHPARSSGNPGNPGLRLLGPLGVTESYTGVGGPPASDDSAIYADIVAGVDWLLSRGFPDARHMALPQGGWDMYVRSACLRAGLLSVRGISHHTKGFPIRGALPVGPSVGVQQENSSGSGTFIQYSGWMELPGAVQVDGATTPSQADILAYYTEGKRVGATMSCYTHSNAGLANFDYLCSLLKADQDAGLIRVMTVADYYEQGFDWGGWTPFDGSMPPLSLAATCPGSLLEVQEWSKPNVTKKQIDKASR